MWLTITLGLLSFTFFSIALVLVLAVSKMNRELNKLETEAKKNDKSN